MQYWVDLRLKAMNFFKKHKRKILIFLIIWLIVIMIEYFLRSHQTIKLPEPTTTYKPHVSVMDSKQAVPEKYQEPIEKMIDEYFNYCNSGEYENAYNMITDDCKKAQFPSLEEFKKYIDNTFKGRKRKYTIQCFSIVGNKYIYNIKILDDILSTGTNDITSEEDWRGKEEKIILIEENGQFKLSVAEFIEDVKENIASEDMNIKVKIVDKKVYYDTEEYTVEVENLSDYYMVISDNSQKDEIILSVSGDSRRPTNMDLAFFFIPAHSKRTQKLKFTKFYDDNASASKLVFNSVRLLKDYDWIKGTTQENLDNAVYVFPFEIKF